jgi:hypothetical protein
MRFTVASPQDVHECAVEDVIAGEIFYYVNKAIPTKRYYAIKLNEETEDFIFAFNMELNKTINIPRGIKVFTIPDAIIIL